MAELDYDSIKNPEDVLKVVKDNDVTFINLWFPNVLGQLRNVNIPKGVLGEALEEGIGFDGSSIEGFVRIEESDLIARPIESSLRILPYRQQDKDKSVSMFAKIHNPDGSRFEGDSLYVLERQLDKMKKMGFDEFYLGPELEFFLFKDNNPENLPEKILDKGGYFGLADDKGQPIRRDVILACEKMGIGVEASHHEVAPSQNEIALKYDSAINMALKAMAYRRLVKEVAMKHGVYATFLPKPIHGENGSGMHIHQSLFKEGKNAFFDINDSLHLSQDAKHYIAGILKHASEIAAASNQWINSYQRLVPGYEAPTELSWARRNRSTAIRVPMYKPKKEKASRIETRFPDPACNIPLTFALMLAAGLEGIKNKYPLPEPTEENIFEMSLEERKKRGIYSLPGNLNEATKIMENSAFVKRVLGEHIHTSLVENQKIQWKKYRREVRGKDIEDHLVTDYELQKLFPLV